jgi:hypothetical protein
VQADLKPWLIEINSSPDFSYSTPVTEELVRRVSEDTARVVVDYADWEADRAAARAEARAAVKRTAAAAAAATGTAPTVAPVPSSFGARTKPFTAISARGTRPEPDVRVASQRSASSQDVRAATEPVSTGGVAKTSSRATPREPSVAVVHPPAPPSGSVEVPATARAIAPPPDTGGWQCVFKSPAVAGSLTCTAHDIMCVGTAIKRTASCSAASSVRASSRTRRQGAQHMKASLSAALEHSEEVALTDTAEGLLNRPHGKAAQSTDVIASARSNTKDGGGPGASGSAHVPPVATGHESSSAAALGIAMRPQPHTLTARAAAPPLRQSAPVRGSAKAPLRMGSAGLLLDLTEDGAGTAAAPGTGKDTVSAHLSEAGGAERKSLRAVSRS